MNITRDVVIDLLPAYLSGEASADTHTLIDEMAARDPDIARLVASARDERMDVMPENIPLPPNLERDIVNRTRTGASQKGSPATSGELAAASLAYHAAGPVIAKVALKCKAL